MAEPFIGQIIMFGGDFAPRGWALCQGQLLQAKQYPELFNLIGRDYGGDGKTTFAVPDLRSRVPIHYSPTYPLGVAGGTDAVTLTLDTMPSHSHAFFANNRTADKTAPVARKSMLGVVPATSEVSIYAPTGSPIQALNPLSIKPAGEQQPHENRQPFQVVNYIIALAGRTPTPSPP
jgi:microcystin-dependent protein